MKKLLITGFDPFGGQTVNPAWEAVSRLPDRIGSYALTRCRIPTAFGRAPQAVLNAARDAQPDVILCIGQAGGRRALTPEMVAINLRHASIPDNDGNRPQDQPVAVDGPAAYFATVPVRAMAQAAEAAGVGAAVSYSAGTFVCNDTLYTLLHHYRGTAVRVGFVHVPFLPRQAENGQPSMALEDMVRGLTAMIESLS